MAALGSEWFSLTKVCLQEWQWNPLTQVFFRGSWLPESAWELGMTQLAWVKFTMLFFFFLYYGLFIIIITFGGNPSCSRAFLVTNMVKSLPVFWGTQVQSLDWEDPLEEEMAAHSRILAWKIPWMEEPGRLQSMGLQRVGHDWVTTLHFTSFFVQECWEQIMQIILWFPIAVF